MAIPLEDLVEKYSRGEKFSDYLPLYLPNGVFLHSLPQKCSNCNNKIAPENISVISKVEFSKTKRFEIINFCPHCKSFSELVFSFKVDINDDKAGLLSACVNGEWKTYKVYKIVPISKKLYDISNNIFKFLWSIFFYFKK